jgi:hypothetical protein
MDRKDIFQSGQVVVVGGASRAAVVMNGNWRKCVVEVMANGEPVAEFGVAKLISRGASTSGHSGSRWEVWIDKDPQQVEFFVKGLHRRLLSWSGSMEPEMPGCGRLKSMSDSRLPLPRR